MDRDPAAPERQHRRLAEDLQLAALHLPAAHGHEVGGDWYDTFALKDATATATTGTVRDVLRGVAWDARRPRRRPWTSAGHPPPARVHPDGTVEVLWTPWEFLLGVNAGTGRTDHALALPAGSTLLLHTDGLIERRHEPCPEAWSASRGRSPVSPARPWKTSCTRW